MTLAAPRPKVDIERVKVLVMRRRLRWLRHVERMDDTCSPKALLMYQLLVVKWLVHVSAQ